MICVDYVKYPGALPVSKRKQFSAVWMAVLDHYLPLDGMVNIPIYLVWAFWVRNGTTFLSDNRYFEIQT